MRSGRGETGGRWKSMDAGVSGAAWEVSLDSVTRTRGILCTLLTSSDRSAEVGASIATPEPGDNGRLSSSEETFCEWMVRSCSSWATTCSTGLRYPSWAEVSSVSAVA